jgi:Lrp/AsnC family leucine-responsive transcriptional regulator
VTISFINRSFVPIGTFAVDNNSSLSFASSDSFDLFFSFLPFSFFRHDKGMSPSFIAQYLYRNSVKYANFAPNKYIITEFYTEFIMETLDEKDAEILKILQKDARSTVKEISAQINLSPSPTFDRQKRLEKENFIKGYVAVVDYKKAGNGLIVICNVRLREQNRECGLQFIDAITVLDEVAECYNTSGDYDFMLKIYLRDMEHYRDFVFNKLGSLKCIGNFHSTFVITEAKNSYSVPIYSHK